MIMVHAMYFGMAISTTGLKSSLKQYNVHIGELRRDVKEVKRLLEARWNENCETGLYRSKVHLLHHSIGALDLFGYLEGLDALPCKRLNAHVMRTYMNPFR